ncbi:hypothetical protein J7337_003513 [Fusarium musae]|uniref:Uncharacterized protein n=1 Tax=Fusarium musae TaxID=1042133 RepID=A0A9P8DKS5_9HYPO|nr:hypothetical protein J7337_003513 [Fusarium musae]KAG9503562.1 hypothetical protein J7337_003513 [Fusarium musae]
MSDTIQSATNIAETADRNALMEEAIEIASQWAQEKIENFLSEIEYDIERNGNDHKLLKISHIISRRTSIDVFTGESSDIGKFAKDLIAKLDDGKVMEGLGNLAGSLLNKLFGSASGSAQTEKIYEVVSDELGELNRLDAFFFCYRFASRGINKAVIGTCIVRSAAVMVDDNAYRVVLNSSATLEDAERAAQVAKYQRQVLDENGNPDPADSTLLEARAKLARWTRDQSEAARLALNQKALETAKANYTKAVEAAAEVQKRLTGIQTNLKGIEIAEQTDMLHKIGVPMPAAGIIQAMRTDGEVVQDAVQGNLPTGMRVEQNADAAFDV